MSVHIFIDESERSGYLLAATVVPPSELHRNRVLLRSLLLPGERRIHFKSERDQRRRLILSQLASTGLNAYLYHTKSKGEPGRKLLLRRAVQDAAQWGASRLVIESRTISGNKRDRATLAEIANDTQDLVYEHMHAYQEPVLWVSDAVAWCWGAGDDWRRRAKPIVTSARKVDP